MSNNYAAFEPTPYPERISWYSFREPTKPQPMLSIGVRLISEDHDGLKIKPYKAVVVSFSQTQTNEEVAAFDLTPDMARGVAKRMIEMADSIE